MRIAANLNVLDEIGFIEICIQHLRSIGVDVVVLTDLGSIDGTADHLENFASNPRTVGVGTGTHRIVEKGAIKPTVIRPDDMIIAHVPFSTYNRFLRKMGNIEKSLTVSATGLSDLRRGTGDVGFNSRKRGMSSKSSNVKS